LSISLAERGFVPDFIIRLAIRRLLRYRLTLERHPNKEVALAHEQALIAQFRNSPIAVFTDAANQQHYEVPAKFFTAALGPAKKYSCCEFPTPETNLAEAELAALQTVCERAELEDGQSILDLGCGWGSFSLFAAARYPKSNITALSNSHAQREYIEARCRERSLTNLSVITGDITQFNPNQTFDRVVSIEMFEHLRNHRELMERIAAWLHPRGQLFVHIFCHRELTYLFETEGDDNWMGRYFFTGGMMPSETLLLHFQDALTLEQRWRVNGRHYQRTAEAWLEQLDQHRTEVLELFRESYGAKEAVRWFHRWRIFFLACAELFGYRNGDEWYVAHYRFSRS